MTERGKDRACAAVYGMAERLRGNEQDFNY